MKRVVFDLTLIAILHYIGIYMDLYWEPVIRDIPFCMPGTMPWVYLHDKLDNTVTPAAVVTGSGLIPMAIMIFIDTILCRKRKWDVYKNIVSFEIGGLLVFVSNNFLKYNLGYHRPYFLTVCKPEGVMCIKDGRMGDPTCTGDPKEIKWARLSFPSLHSSITAYGVLFMMVFLYRRRQKVVDLYRYFYSVLMAIIAVSTLTWTVFVCLTRITDGRHHMIDVIGGLTWGAVISMITIITMGPEHKGADDIDIQCCLSSKSDESKKE